MSLQILGWPCASVAASVASKQSECATANGGTLSIVRIGEQCLCNYTRTIYPLAVEELGVTFGYAYRSMEKKGVSKLSGSSRAAGDAVLRTFFQLSNGTVRTWQAGGAYAGEGQPQMTLRELLASAGVASLASTISRTTSNARKRGKSSKPT